MTKTVPAEIDRFDLQARIQHIILFTTFLLLAFTGWGLKYAYAEPSSMWIRVWGGAKTAGIIHRVAGVIMLTDFLYHIVYMSRKILTGRMRLTLIPMPQDILDVIQNIGYFVGVTKEKPKFGQFSYMQKFDYWAVFWGMAIIGTSGLILTFPVFFSSLFPSWSVQWIWDVIIIMHSDEALLAIVFILFFHFYNEHLKSDVFPMNWVWLTGKISTGELKHKHPLEYEHLFGKDARRKK